MPQNEEVLSVITESLTDGETIAKSALKLAIDRAMDLGQNPIITVMMLRALCNVAIDDHNSKKLTHFPMEMQDDAMDWMEDMIESTIKQGWEKHKASR